MSRVSIIVPVYNGSLTIERCVRSIICQDFTDFELIIVDDGSTDDTRTILKKILTKDKRCRLVSQRHKGVSAARNLGVSCAKSQWVTFIDADDYISPNMLKNNVRIIDTYDNLDIIIGNMDEMSIDDEFADKKCLIETVIDIDYGKKKYGNRYGNCRCIGGKFYRRSLLIRHSISFSEELSAFEDGVFNLYAYKNARNIFINPRKMYTYSISMSSASRVKSISRIKDNDMAVRKIKKFIRDSDYSLGQALPYCCWNLLRGDFAIISNCFGTDSPKKMGEKYQEYKEIFEGKIKIKFLSLKSLIIYVLARFRLFSLIYLLYFWSSKTSLGL